MFQYGSTLQKLLPVGSGCGYLIKIAWTGHAVIQAPHPVHELLMSGGAMPPD